MITSDNVLLTSGVILTVLISATVITYTNNFIFLAQKQKKSTNQIYESPFFNSTMICIFSERPYSTKYENTLCSNKTLLQWYNPWLSNALWEEFWRDLRTIQRLRKESDSPSTIPPGVPFSCEPVPEELPEDKRKEVERIPREKPVEFVYSVLVGLLVVSGVVACWEVCKERLKKNETAGQKAQERECSLAEFTIKRHLRRESQQQTGSHLQRQASLELTAKVTQTLTHQSSLDRALPKNTSQALSSAEPRRNSVPLYLSDIHQVTGGGRSGKRQSMDVSTEDTGLDSRRKSRHFIRRH